MKITMRTLSARPDGIALPGCVLDLAKNEAERLIQAGYARAYDASLDSKAPRGRRSVADTDSEREGWGA